MSQRIHNFSAGPSALPLPVLEQAQAELVDFEGSGMSIMEMSHRGPIYERVHAETIANVRTLLGIPSDYEVLFLQGGGRGLFAMVPMNLLGDGEAGYLNTGSWADGAIKEAQKLGRVNVLYSSAESTHDHVPQPGDFEVPSSLAYFHYTTNNTIYGTQFHYVPDTGEVPLVCDMSSDIISKHFDISKFGLVYAGAQKNMGPSGVTLALVRKDLLARSPDTIPEVFNFKKVAAKNSMLNTPPTFAIYLMGLVAKYWLKQGGVSAAAALNEQKASALYGMLDASEFYTGRARKDSRSKMNVTWRLPSEELEKEFVAEAQEAGLNGLKGHRSAGGIRASIYNAVPLAAVEALVSFAKDFEARRG